MSGHVYSLVICLLFFFQPIMETTKPKLVPINEGGTTELLNKVVSSSWQILCSHCSGNSRVEKQWKELELVLVGPVVHLPHGPAEGVHSSWSLRAAPDAFPW